MEKGLDIAKVSTYQGGAEHVANPGMEDCNISAGRYNFAFYMGVEDFKDLSEEHQKIFYEEWRKGVAAEKKACGLL